MYKQLSCTIENVKKLLTTDFQIISNENAYVPRQVYINKELYDTNYILLERDVFMKKARKLARSTEDVIFENINTDFDVYNGRKYIVDILNALRCNILLQKDLLEDEVIDDLMKNLGIFMSEVSISNFDDKALNRLITGGKLNNECIISECFHLYLDLQWLNLTTCYLCIRNRSLLHDKLKRVIRDLLFFAKFVYSKKVDVYSKVDDETSFICHCYESIWIGLENLTMKVWDSEMEFWSLFNKEVKDDDYFSLWLLNQLAVDIARDNYQLIQDVLKQILSNNCPEDRLLKLLQMLRPLINELWLKNAKIDPYLILWDYYFKKLNLMEINYPTKVINFLEFINMEHVREDFSSYEYYVKMLMCHLKTHPTHWSKLKGRVYARLPAHKVAEFTKKGVLNISIFFFAALEINFDESSKKFIDLLSNFPKTSCDLISIIYMTLMIKYILNGNSVKQLGETVCQLMEEISSNRNEYYIVQNVIEGFEYVMNISNNYQLKQHSIFGGWVSKYMQACQYANLCYLLNVLVSIIEKVANTEDIYEWMSIYNKYIVPSAKQIINTVNLPPQFGRLLGLIVKNTSDKTELLTCLSNSVISPKVVGQFLCTLFEGESETIPIPLNSETILVQLWVNCAVLGVEIDNNIVRKVFELDLFALLNFNGFEKNSYLNLLKTIENSRDVPISKIKSFCESIFGHLDVVIKNALTFEELNFDMFHVYRSMGQLFQYCSVLIYDKLKSNCLLSRLISTLLLPTDVLRGTSPKTVILNAIESNYYLFISGLFKLDYVNDPFIERTLKDVIIKYLPHFSTVQSPILCCFEEETVAHFALDKINRNVLIRSAKCSEEITHKALKVIQTALEECGNLNIIKLIVEITLPGIFDILMYNTNKQVAIELIKILILSEWYVHVNNELKSSIKLVLVRNLAFNANNVFQLIGILIKLIPDDVRSLIPDIKNQITTVERMRGVGYDTTLRNALYKIENSL